MKKRIISLLLCLCMVFSLLPMSVFAEDVATQTLDEPTMQTLDEPTEENEDGIAPAKLDTGHKIDVTFTVLYVGDEFNIGYNYGTSEKTQFVCQYTTNHSDTAYNNHTIAISDIKAAAGRATVKSGYNIVGWSKESSANPKTWPLNKSGTTACNKGTTIYLVAKNPNPSNKFTLIYNENGGKPEIDDDTWNGQGNSHKFTVSSTTLTKAGYDFKGWKDGSNTVQPGDSVTVSKDDGYTKTLTAIWEEHKHKDDNGDGFCDDDQACMHPKDSNGYCTVSGCTHPTSCCPKKTDPQPSVPEFGEEQLAGMQVKVQCETVNGHAKNYHFNELDGCYSTSAVMEDNEGGYHVTVTLNRSSVVEKFNADEAAGGKPHDDTEPNAITSWTWKWNASDKAWSMDTAPITDAWATIVVKCEEKQTVQVVIYRNGDTEKAYKTVALEKMPKGTVIDLTKLNIADYYTANYTGKYDFYGWFNDGAWNEYKKNPERAGLESITVNGWTNLKCMVYDYEKVVYYMSDADRVADKRLFETTARKGAALPTADAPTATRDGYTFKFWSREGQIGTDVTGQTVNGWTNLVANWKVTPHNIYAYARLNSYFAPLTTKEFDTPVTLNAATLSRLGLGSYNGLGYISIGSFDFDAVPLAGDQYFGDDAELDAVVTELAESIALENGVSEDTAEKIAWTVLYKTVNEEDMAPGYPAEDGYQLSGNLDLATVMFKAGGENVTGMPAVNYTYDNIIEIHDFYFAGDTFTLPADPTREGYSFEGWSVEVISAENDADHLDADGSDDAADEKLLKAGDTYTITAGGVVFTAQWKLNTYIIASTLRINGNEPVKETGKTYSWSHRYGGDFGVTIDYTEMFKALKDKTLEVDVANEPYDAEIKLCFPGSKDRLFNEEILTYGQEGGGWNPGVKNTAYIWGYATTSYEVIFNSDGGSAVDTQIVKYGEKAVKPEDPTMKGYNFLGWFDKDGNLFDFDTEITHKTELKAQWEKKDYIIASDLRVNNGEPVKDEGKTFSWTHRYGGKYEETIDYQPMFDALKARALEADKANEPNQTKVDVELRIPGSKDRLFNEEIHTYGQDGGGWNPGVKNTAYIWGYAWTYYDVTFVTGVAGQTVEPQLVKSGDKAVKPEDPTMKGYNFLGWFDKDGNLFDFDTEITHKTELKAQWEKKDYIIASDLRVNNGEPVKETGKTYSWSHRYGGKYEETINYQPMFDALKARALEADKANEPNPTRVDVELRFPGSKDRLFNEEIHTYGQEGGGWNPGVKNTAYIWGYAWTYYDVTFVTGVAGQTVEPQLVKSGDKAVKPEDPAMKGYNFLGWFDKDGNPFDFDTEITHKTELKAQWEKKDYIIASDLRVNGGEAVKDEGKTYAWTHRYGGKYEETINYQPMFDALKARALEADKANEPNPTRVDVELRFPKSSNLFNEAIQTYGQDGGGWNPGVKNTAYIWGYAWTYYDVTFVTPEGATTVDAKLIRNGDCAAKPADPTKEGWKFLGWYADAAFTTEFDFNAPITKKTSVYAKFELVSTPIGDTYVRYDVLHIKQLPDGSYDEANAEIEHLQAKKDSTVTAVVKDYSASHHVTVNTDKSLLKATAIQPHAGADGKPVYTILKVYYDLDYHTLTFDTMGGSRIDPVTVRHGNAVAKPKDPVNGGYIFDGWYTDKTYRIPYNFATVLTQDTTIYAKWFLIALPGVTVKKTTPKLNTSDHFAYVQGYPDGTVKPTGNITRAETAAILFRLMDEDSRKTYYSTKSGFRDVAAGSWYNTYVATLNNAGVITDSSNGYFRPNKAITRAELAAMLAQFADTKSAPNYFTDVTANYWAANAIAVCAKLGWINGYPDGTFRPDQTVTRAEMMAMINRALERTPKSAADLLAGMKVWSDNANVNAWYYLDVQEATNSHTYTKSGTHETWKKLR